MWANTLARFPCAPGLPSLLVYPDDSVARLNGEYVDDAGQRVEGRTAIEKIYTEIFAASPEAKIEIAVDSIRLVASNGGGPQQSRPVCPHKRTEETA